VTSKLGAFRNSTTNQDRTLYYLVANTGYLDKITDIEADRFQHLKDSEDEFKTADAARLKDRLVRGEPTPITYSASPKPAITAEDRIISALPLGVKEADITILPIDRVFQ
jgi:hypothetical protein